MSRQAPRMAVSIEEYQDRLARTRAWMEEQNLDLLILSQPEHYNWLSGYDHGKQAGTLHVAGRHQVPGKKFFTWGTGPGGLLWDKILSDTDGPYLELLVGAWRCNQPD